MVENVEPAEKPRTTMGFAVSGAPLWLCKALSEEAKEYYADVYWPVIVDWYRKAKEYEYIIRGGLPREEQPREVEVEKKIEEPTIRLFGGNVGRKER